MKVRSVRVIAPVVGLVLVRDRDRHTRCRFSHGGCPRWTAWQPLR